MTDCTKTAEFLREWQRLCKPQSSCFDCPVGLHGDCRIQGVHEIEDIIGAIAIVQKWSDEHQVMTWERKLKELLPNVDMSKIIGTCCPYNLLGGEAPNMETCRSSGDYEDCVNCWNGEYKEGP